MANNNIHINVTTNADTADKSIRSLDTSINKSVARASSLTKSFKFLDRAVNSGKIDLIQYAQADKSIRSLDTSINKSVARASSLTKSFKFLDRAVNSCLLYTSPSPRDGLLSRMPSSA